MRLAALLVMFATTAAAQPSAPEWIAPPEPAVRPYLPARVELDADNNRVDDRIDRKVGSLRRRLARETSFARREQIAARLAEPVRVEVVFSEQVTQQQIDDFLTLGGRIGHLYRSVSYGWSGTLPAASIDALPAALGASLLVVAEETDAQLHMDEATRTGRVRPIWAPGFAGSQNGIAGTSDITIGVMDSGVDDSHPDLAGRLEYWKDYTSDNEASPRDVIQHGSHVAGIALGSGAVFGSGTGTLRFTDSGNLAGVANNSFFLSGIHVPAVPLTFNLSSTWVGGGSTLLRVAARTNGVGGGFISICNTLAGGSPLTLNCNTTGNVTQIYSSALPQNSGGSVGRYATTVSVGPYSGVGDGFNSFRGVAPGARWAGAKVFTNAGSGSSGTIGAAMDDLVAQRTAHDIKVVNMSLGLIGSPGVDAALRAKANTMVGNGIIVVASAGNDGPGVAAANTTDDPGRAALVLTVGATNDANALTRYTSSGFSSPGSDEDYKPDLLAPGGSDYYSQVMSVDSNDADAEISSFADRVADDYLNQKGTSMSAPFAAGSAALVVDAMQKAGTTWSFSSSSQPLFVKMLLCASSTETNANREASSGTNPVLGRAAAPKDLYEGYGLLNPDAAVEAISQVYSGGSLGGSTAGGAFDRRAWGRRLGITSGPAVTITLTVPVTADYDLYLYSATPDSKGNPVLRASSTNAGLDADESITFTPTSTETRYLFVKRVSGSGDWSLTSGTATSSCGDGTKNGSEQCDDGNQAGGDCCSADCKFESNGSPCDDGLFCTATDTCSSGTCSGAGNPCSTGGECNNACNEANDGCASPFGLACSSDSNPCTVDQCNGQGSCTHPAGNGGTLCRAAAGGCDVAETCTGLVTTCPLDAYAPSLTSCRAPAGVCDVAESCSGLSPSCPADTYLGSATVCRTSAGVCDLEERCTGAGATCPSNTLAGTSTVCRATSGVCDAQETCSGSSASCPADAVASSATTCRASAGDCDSAETCDGAGKSCPADVLREADTACASDGLPCTEDVCNGTSSSCTHAAGNSGAVCRAAAGSCDVQETCNGTSTGCPADGFAATSTVCRGTSGVCDAQETCSGTSASCPADGFAGTTTTCRASAGECDVAETCSGSAKTCPANALASSNTTCTSDDNACTSDICNGSSATCQHVSSGACENCGDGNIDNGEVCDDGNTAGGDCCSSTCTSAAGNGTTCNDGQYCNGADSCQAGACSQHAGDPCDGPDGDADCSEACNEAADACSANDPDASGCDDGQFCNGADTCQSGTCSQHAGDPCDGPDGDDDCSESCKEANDTCTTVDPDASPCDDGVFCNGADTCKSGSCGQHVGDPCTGPDGDGNCAESCDEGAGNCSAADPNGSACSDNAFCNGADTCSGGECSQHAGDPCLGADGDSDCTESCSEAGDNCSAADPNGSPCSDGLPCTINDSCTAGVCGGDSSPAAECTGSTTTTTMLPETTCGDANDDGAITAGDALVSLKTAVGTSECALEVCDYNGDERVTATDASLILRTAVGQNIAPKCPGTISGLEPVTSTLPVTTTTLFDDGF